MPEYKAEQGRICPGCWWEHKHDTMHPTGLRAYGRIRGGLDAYRGLSYGPCENPDCRGNNPGDGVTVEEYKYHTDDARPDVLIRFVCRGVSLGELPLCSVDIYTKREEREVIWSGSWKELDARESLAW